MIVGAFVLPPIRVGMIAKLTSAAGACDNAGDMKERNVPTATLHLT